jgi:glycosyltransferase involved in cell wall biosynthesis
MITESASVADSLRILHVFRAPVGGLFRHVVDLATEQAARGHRVGIICDSTTGGETAERALERLRPILSLGVIRRPMRRDPHPSDLAALADVSQAVRSLRPDVVHGHGSKGGFYARLPGLWSFRRGPVRAYTPHGGSLNQRPGSFSHRLYMKAERLLDAATDVFLFESAYIGARHDALVGRRRGLVRIVANGLGAGEFEPVAPAPDAADFIYIGELRQAKGVDTMLDALALVRDRTGHAPTAAVVGSGPDRDALIAHSARLGLSDRVAFKGILPARQAFRLGRIMVVPSRTESMPYVVLEAAAARVPLIATKVGGVPEIFGPYADRLGPPDDPGDLAARMMGMMARPKAARDRDAAELANFVGENFSISVMVDAVLDGYRNAGAMRRAYGRPAGRMALSHNS